jgi:hypothetical protein
VGEGAVHIPFVTVVFASLLFVPDVGLAQNQDASSIVKHCVGVVNKMNQDDLSWASFYREFDAYYEPTTKLVHNNARTVGAQKPYFQFQKCMSEQGMPLTKSK